MPPPDGRHTPETDEGVGGRRAVLAALTRAGGPQTVAELARTLAVHPNTVRTHLAALQSAGQVGSTAAITNRPGRPTLRYVAIPGMDPGGIRHYRHLAGVLADELARRTDGTGRIVEIGQEWGRQLSGPAPARRTGGAAVRRAVEVLAQLGFDPAPVDATSGAAIELRHCPFLEVAQAQPGVICALHLGMVRGILARSGSAVTATGIEPFARPDRCLITLGPGASAAADRRRAEAMT